MLKYQFHFSLRILFIRRLKYTLSVISCQGGSCFSSKFYCIKKHFFEVGKSYCDLSLTIKSVHLLLLLLFFLSSFYFILKFYYNLIGKNSSFLEKLAHENCFVNRTEKFQKASCVFKSRQPLVIFLLTVVLNIEKFWKNFCFCTDSKLV